MKAKNIWVAVALAVMVGSIGCAGGGGKSTLAAGGGNLSIGVIWPEPSRLVPLASNSIRVDVFDGANLVASNLIAKPLTIATFNNVPTGNLTVVATAYPELDGTGVAQATGTAGATITVGNTTVVNLTMGSTITEIEMNPSTINLTAGDTSSVTATPKDANGNVVLVSPLNVTYVSSNPLVATVGALDGSILSLLAGSTTITATELESGVSGSATVQVEIGVNLTPGSTSVGILGTRLFVATVAGSANQLVTWSVLEGGGGSIVAGLYTAPVVAGTYHVRATSVADPTKSATATVTVTSGGLIVNVN